MPLPLSASEGAGDSSSKKRKLDDDEVAGEEDSGLKRLKTSSISPSETEKSVQQHTTGLPDELDNFGDFLNSPLNLLGSMDAHLAVNDNLNAASAATTDNHLIGDTQDNMSLDSELQLIESQYGIKTLVIHNSNDDPSTSGLSFDEPFGSITAVGDGCSVECPFSSVKLVFHLSSLHDYQNGGIIESKAVEDDAEFDFLASFTGETEEAARKSGISHVEAVEVQDGAATCLLAQESLGAMDVCAMRITQIIEQLSSVVASL